VLLWGRLEIVMACLGRFENSTWSSFDFILPFFRCKFKFFLNRSC